MALGFSFSCLTCVACQQLLYQLSSILFLNPNELKMLTPMWRAIIFLVQPVLAVFLTLAFRNPITFSVLITADSSFKSLRCPRYYRRAWLVLSSSRSSCSNHILHCLWGRGAEGVGWAGALAGPCDGDTQVVRWQQLAWAHLEGCCTWEKPGPSWRDITIICTKLSCS